MWNLKFIRKPIAQDSTRGYVSMCACVDADDIEPLSGGLNWFADVPAMGGSVYRTNDAHSYFIKWSDSVNHSVNITYRYYVANETEWSESITSEIFRLRRIHCTYIYCLTHRSPMCAHHFQFRRRRINSTWWENRIECAFRSLHRTNLWNVHAPRRRGEWEIYSRKKTS